MSGQAGYTQDDIDEFIQTLRSRTQFIVPDSGFDARTAPNEQLLALGLPPRSEDPRLQRMWNVFFERKLTFLGAETLTIAPGSGGKPVRAMQRHTPDALTAPSGRVLTSHNWSGATIAPSGGRRFTDVYGIWKVPAVTAPSPPPSGSAPEYYSSIFIGLDGQRRYFDASLPQIGTRQDITADGTRYETWFEWFALFHDVWPTKLGVGVSPGERVMAWLTVLDATSVRLMIRNLDRTPPEACALTLQSPSVTTAGGARQPRVSGATAQWIFERPTSKAGVLETLPVFDDVEFLDCFAVAAGGAIASAKVHGLVGARLSRMLARHSPPHRTALLAVPDIPPGLRLRVRRA